MSETIYNKDNAWKKFSPEDVKKFLKGLTFKKTKGPRPSYEVRCEECHHKFMIDKPVGWWNSKARRMQRHKPKEQILHTVAYCPKCKSDQLVVMLRRIDSFVCS